MYFWYKTNIIKELIVIAGPTAGGKTAVSIALAKHLNTCVFSADSRQFYKELSIGTAKPTLAEQNGVQHYFIDSHSIKDEVSAAQYEKEALPLLFEKFKEHDQIILTGGSGLFIDALCYGLDNIPTDPKIKKKYQLIFEEKGIEVLQKKLQEKDSEFYHQVDLTNSRRLIRALEAIEITGEKYSLLRTKNTTPRPFSIKTFIIDHQREVLYQRINYRVDEMMKQGLLKEVKSVYSLRHLTSLNTVGYKEIFEYLDNKISLEKAIDLIKRNTRRYAKRQLTWFRRNKDAIWIPFQSVNQVVNDIITLL